MPPTIRSGACKLAPQEGQIVRLVDKPATSQFAAAGAGEPLAGRSCPRRPPLSGIIDVSKNRLCDKAVSVRKRLLLQTWAERETFQCVRLRLHSGTAESFALPQSVYSQGGHALL